MKKKIFWVIIGILILVAGTLLCGYVSRRGGKWFQESNISKWHWHNKQAPSDDGTEQSKIMGYDNNGNVLCAGETYALPAAITLLSTESPATYCDADSELFLQASLSNEYINGSFIWSVDFADSSAAWASGKSAENYVTVTADTSDSSKATFSLTGYPSFETQIIIRVKAVEAQTESVVTVDCLRHVDISLSDGTYQQDFNTGFNLNIPIVLGGGTIDCDSAELENLYIALSSDFKSAVSSKVNFPVSFKDFSYGATTGAVLDLENSRITITREQFGYGDFIEGFETYSQEQREAIYFAWYKSAQAQPLGYNVEVSVSLYCGYSACPASNDLLRAEDKLGKITGQYFGQNIVPGVNVNYGHVIV